MSDAASSPLTVLQRRRARRQANHNGALWAIGNGLASSQLVVYLAMEFDAPRLGLGIGFILAAQHLVGVLRLGVPLLIGRGAGRKRFCLVCYLLSGLVLLALPAVAVPGWLPSAGAALVALWCAYHLLEYLAGVALWAWLADLVPTAVRGRFLGRRERWMTAGQAAAMLAGGLLVWGWQRTWPETPPWIAYAVTAALGAGFMIAAVVPLAAMPEVAPRPPASNRGRRAELLAPLADGRFLRLLAAGCWLSISNGLIQSPQNVFVNRVLGIHLLAMLALKVGLRLGQWSVTPGVGRLADRLGNRPVMIASILLIAPGPWFYFLATPQQPWWIAGAWVCWIAWAGLNIGQPNLLLKLAPRHASLAYVAAWFAVTGLCHGLSTLLGGALFDRYGQEQFHGFGTTLDYYQAAFLFGGIAWGIGALLLARVVREPAMQER